MAGVAAESGAGTEAVGAVRLRRVGFSGSYSLLLCCCVSLWVGYGCHGVIVQHMALERDL